MLLEFLQLKNSGGTVPPTNDGTQNYTTMAAKKKAAKKPAAKKKAAKKKK